MVEERITKTELQTHLLQKANVNDIRKISEMISGVQDLHNSVGSLESRLAESISDMQKQLNQTVSMPEFKQLRKQMETFVTAEHLAEELKSKANKASVANALSRKANKQELSDLADQKADLADLEKICGILEQKADTRDISTSLKPIAEQMASLKHFDQLCDIMKTKAEKSDLDSCLVLMKELSKEIEAQKQALTKEFSSRLKETALDIEAAKNEMKESLSYKADFASIDKIRDQLVSKCDYEYVQSLLGKLRTEFDQQIELGMNSSAFAKRSADQQHQIQTAAVRLELEVGKMKDELALTKESLSRLTIGLADPERTSDLNSKVLNLK